MFEVSDLLFSPFTRFLKQSLSSPGTPLGALVGFLGAEQQLSNTRVLTAWGFYIWRMKGEGYWREENGY